MARGEESLRLELRRRRATTAAERGRVPPPRPPTFRRSAALLARGTCGSWASTTAPLWEPDTGKCQGQQVSGQRVSGPASPVPPGTGGHPPSLDRPPAARPWRAPWPGDLGKSGQLNWIPPDAPYPAPGGGSLRLSGIGRERPLSSRRRRLGGWGSGVSTPAFWRRGAWGRRSRSTSRRAAG